MSSFSNAHDRRVGRLKNLVGFELDSVHYAIEITRVREIIHPIPYVAIPHAPPSVIGVADHRGAVVPVVDTRHRFGLARVEPTRRTRWIVVDAKPTRVALVVDEVSDVFGTQPEEQRSVPALGSGDDARGILAVYSSRGRLIFVIDVDRVAQVAATVDVAFAATLLGEGT
jgi:purine-binding chemotaxis protein CheW